MSKPKYPQVTVSTDDPYSLITPTMLALKNAGVSLEDINTFCDECMRSISAGGMLLVIKRWVNVE